jgi:hypothetical protein
LCMQPVKGRLNGSFLIMAKLHGPPLSSRSKHGTNSFLPSERCLSSEG